MGKIIYLYILLYAGLHAEEFSFSTDELENKCLQCHKQEQIPNTLIYGRYLMKYSTEDAITKAIMKYLKNPQKENSIMPRPFFSKFPMKIVGDLDDVRLEQNIRAFLDLLDIKKKLVLPKTF